MVPSVSQNVVCWRAGCLLFLLRQTLLGVCFVHLFVGLDDLGMLCNADEWDFFRNLCLLDCIDQIIECYLHGHMGLSRAQSLFLFFVLIDIRLVGLFA
jgi:hypothetical protein